MSPAGSIWSPPRSRTRSQAARRPTGTGSVQVLAGCRQLLKTGGLLVTCAVNVATVDELTVFPRLVDLASLTVAYARQIGFRYVQHLVALRVPIHGDALAAGTAAHGDVLVFSDPPADRGTSRGIR
jgi:hypothetical protein